MENAQNSDLQSWYGSKQRRFYVATISTDI